MSGFKHILDTVQDEEQPKLTTDMREHSAGALGSACSIDMLDLRVILQLRT